MSFHWSASASDWRRPGASVHASTEARDGEPYGRDYVRRTAGHRTLADGDDRGELQPEQMRMILRKAQLF